MQSSKNVIFEGEIYQLLWDYGNGYVEIIQSDDYYNIKLVKVEEVIIQES